KLCGRIILRRSQLRRLHLTSRKHHADDTKGDARFSNRDRETVERLFKRHGRPAIDELINSVEKAVRDEIKPGPSPKLPHSFIAAFHQCWRLHKGGGTIDKFQKDIRDAVEIKSSRKDANLDQLPDLTTKQSGSRHKTVRAFGAYLNRADWK